MYSIKTTQIVLAISMAICLLSAACTKKGDSPVQLIGDTVYYINSTHPFPVDIDKDGIDDIAFSVWDMTWLFSQKDSFTVKPLHENIQIVQNEAFFYVSKDSSICAFSTKDTFVARELKMCSATAQNLYYAKKVKYALVSATKDGTHVYSPFIESSLICKYDYYWSVNNPCHDIESTDLLFGNAIGTKVYLFFKVNGQGYALFMTHQKPYLIFHSVIQVD